MMRAPQTKWVLQKKRALQMKRVLRTRRVPGAPGPEFGTRESIELAYNIEVLCTKKFESFSLR
jgi:hypothetical protein